MCGGVKVSNGFIVVIIVGMEVSISEYSISIPVLSAGAAGTVAFGPYELHKQMIGLTPGALQMFVAENFTFCCQEILSFFLQSHVIKSGYQLNNCKAILVKMFLNFLWIPTDTNYLGRLLLPKLFHHSMQMTSERYPFCSKKIYSLRRFDLYKSNLVYKMLSFLSKIRLFYTLMEELNKNSIKYYFQSLVRYEWASHLPVWPLLPDSGKFFYFAQE